MKFQSFIHHLKTVWRHFSENGVYAWVGQKGNTDTTPHMKIIQEDLKEALQDVRLEFFKETVPQA